MNGTPAVSIIIPVYNAEKYLAETLQSVLAQTFRDFEIILVDDGSTDGTSEIIDKFSDRAICLKNDHRGPASSRNLGLEAAQGSLIAFLDADDLWLPTKLEKQVEANQQLAERLGQVSLTLKAKVGRQGRLYGSITSQDIAAFLQQAENITIDRRLIEMPEPIRALGTFTIPVKVATKLEPKITVNVIDEAGKVTAESNE